MESDGLAIANILESNGFKIKTKTKTSVIVLVKSDRIKQMNEIAVMLHNMGAVVDNNMSGSSIGGIKIGKVKILIKGDGRTGGLDVEAKAISDLSDSLALALALNGGPITVKIGDKSIPGICQVIKTAGTPKSDFHLADANSKALIHISHKKGSKPNDFQQWGGMTEKEISSHKEVQEFILECKAKFGSVMPSGTSVYKKIKNKDLAMMSVFGVDYNKSGTHTNKVDVLLQGDPGLKQIGSHFELTATGHVHHHGDIPDGGFEPVLSLIYKGDRDNFGIKGARASIYPIGGRSMKDIKDYKPK